MNSCCTKPIEVIAEDRHKIGSECCLITEQTSAPTKAECPVSKTVSYKVQRRTIEHLLKPEKVSALRNVQYYYCAHPKCTVVYFSNDKVPYFTISEVNVKVFAKDSGDDVPVCYCFGWTRERIKAEIADTGKSTAAIEIAQQIKAGLCECDVKNPKGRCCLGDVNAVAKEVISTII